jgi:hypothetical protein
MSFHTRGDVASEALLIHPFTSARPISELANLAVYRAWSQTLNDRDLYIAGTAQETIQYTASGSTIDWMASQSVMAFVIESRTPCAEGRWCPPEYADAVHEITRADGRTGTILVQLALNLDKSSILDNKSELLVTPNMYLCFLVTLMIGVMVLSKRTLGRYLLTCPRRSRRKRSKSLEFDFT